MPLTRFTLKVFTADGRECEPFVFRAPSGCHYTEAGIQVALSEFMHHFERQFPGANYRVVRTGKNSFNALPSGANA